MLSWLKTSTWKTNMKNTSKNTTSNQSLLQFFDDFCMVFVKSNSSNIGWIAGRITGFGLFPFHTFLWCRVWWLLIRSCRWCCMFATFGGVVVLGCGFAFRCCWFWLCSSFSFRLGWSLRCFLWSFNLFCGCLKCNVQFIFCCIVLVWASELW